MNGLYIRWHTIIYEEENNASEGMEIEGLWKYVKTQSGLLALANIQPGVSSATDECFLGNKCFNKYRLTETWCEISCSIKPVNFLWELRSSWWWLRSLPLWCDAMQFGTIVLEATVASILRTGSWYVPNYMTSHLKRQSSSSENVFLISKPITFSRHSIPQS
jgi:hypothetical protein